MPYPTRRQFLAASSAATLAAARAKRPNVLIILTDDQGYGDLSLHGNPILKTPNMDSIGRQGVQFTQFHVSPVCSPTRSSLMTGRYNYRTGVVDTYVGRSLMRPDEVTLPQMLQSAGYRTGIFGKWHLGDNYPLRPTDRGFDEALVLHGGGLAQPADAPGSTGYFDPILWHNNSPTKTKGYCTDIFADAASHFMEANRARPFFTYFATNAPHDPLQVEDRYVQPFLGAGVPKETAQLYGMVANLDENVGKLLNTLRTLHLERDTLVIYFSDNGPIGRDRFNAGMRGKKGTVYEGGIRVPCFVRWPGTLKPGATVDRLAAHIDLAPTILEACGVAKPGKVQFDGKSLLPLAKGRKTEWPDRTLFFQWHRGNQPQAWRDCAAHTQRWKLVNGKALYDLDADPAESQDVAASHPEVVAGLRRDYEAWFEDVSARGFDPPRIVIGTDHENPTLLTRQDWRDPGEGWGILGHWEIEVAVAGNYDFTLRFPAQPPAGEAEILVNGAALAPAVPIDDQATSVTVGPLKLPAGKASLEPRLHFGAKTIGPHYCEVRRV
jgi:arylsulfatase A-like enzyme